MKPEPRCPSVNAPAAEYAAWVREHESWTRDNAETINASKQVEQTEPSIGEPDELFTGDGAVFPVDVLPSEMKTWALAQAEFCQVPVTLTATCSLMAAMAAAIRLNVMLAGDEHGSWCPPCVSQMMLVSPPGTRKSPVMGAAFSPVYGWEAEQRKQYLDRVSDLDEQITNLKDQKDCASETSQIKRQKEALKQPKRLTVGDVTPEKHMRLMAENDDTIVLVDDEGDIMAPFLGRYNASEVKLTGLLKGWDGGRLLYDRVGSGGGKAAIEIKVEHARAGVAITTQYKVMNDMLKNPALRDKGLLGRWMYVIMPSHSWTPILHPEKPKPGVNRDYRDAILRLLAISNDCPLRLANGIDRGRGWLEPQWFSDLRMRCMLGAQADGEFCHMIDWASKFPDNMARIAVVLEQLGGGGEKQLTELSDFFIKHAKRFFGSGQTEAPATGTETDELVELVEKIAKKWPSKFQKNDTGLPTLSSCFTARDALRTFNSKRGMTSDRVNAMLDVLIDRGHVREAPSEEAKLLQNKKSVRKFFLVHSSKPAKERASSDIDKPRGQPTPVAKATEFDVFFQDGIPEHDPAEDWER